MTFTTRPTLQGTTGMASSTHWIASQAAMGQLERGGNAFDAAATAGFVLHVVEVLEPAIGYAAAGHPVLERVGTTVASVQKHFETAPPTSAA